MWFCLMDGRPALILVSRSLTRGARLNLKVEFYPKLIFSRLLGNIIMGKRLFGGEMADSMSWGKDKTVLINKTDV